MICHWCDTENPPGSERCRTCKTPLVPPRPQAWLRCPPFASLPLVPGETLSIGRDPSSTLPLPHPAVSRHHAALSVQDGALRLEDRSSFGTYLNGRPVAEATLSLGDRLTIGPYELRLDPPDQRSPDDDQTRPLPMEAAGAPSRLVLIHQLPLLTEGIKALLGGASDLELVGDSGDVKEAVVLARVQAPQGILLALDLSQGAPVEVLEELRQALPHVPTIVLAAPPDAALAEACLRAGARAYLGQQQPPDQLLASIRQALRGQLQVAPELAPQVLSKLARAAATPVVEALSEREREVFEWLGRGLGTRQIAEKLALSVKTIEAHRTNTRRKLGLASTQQLVEEATRWVAEQG